MSRKIGMQEQKFTIGRDRGCDIPIADESVSRLHAQLTLTEGQQIFLTDCQSSNGTFLFRGGQPEPIQQEFISSEDKVQFGSVAFQVKDLLVAIKRKHKQVNTDQLRGSENPPPPVRPKPWAPGKRLVRCVCGAVKVRGERCPTCGER